MYNTVDSLFKGICDSIREKDGTTALIPHQEIPERIMAISGGGAGEAFTSPFYTYANDTLKIENMVVSNFDLLKAVYLPSSFTPGSNTWEIQTKFKTPDEWIHKYPAVFSSNLYRSSIQCTINMYNGARRIWFGFPVGNSNQWSYAVYAEDFDFSPNTWYWLRAIFDGEKYTLNLSTDGITYEEVISINYSGTFYSPENNNQFEFGGNGSDQNKPFDGSIDLKETYIKIGDEIWWGAGKNGTSTQTDE